MKEICGKAFKISVVFFCVGFLAEVATGQCGADGLQRCKPQREAPALTPPVVKIKTGIAAAKPVLPKPNARVSAKNARAAAAAKIAEAEKFYDYAVRGCEDADLRCKIVNFTRAIELHPRYADAYAYRGYVHTQMENRKAALRDFTSAIRFDPRDAHSYYNRAALYAGSFYRGDPGRGGENYAAALRDYAKATELKPDYPDAYHGRAGLFDEKGDYLAALNEYNRGISANPGVFTLYYLRAQLYENRLGNDEAALRDYQAAADRNRQFNLPYEQMAKIWARRGDHAKAIEIFTKYLSMHPLFPTYAYVGRGWSHLRAGDHQAALKDFNEAVKHDADNAFAYFGRAYLYSNALRQQEAAVRDYTKAVELNPRYAEAYHNRGAVYHRLADHDRALKDYTEAIRIKPEYAQAYQNRALLYRRLGLTSLAVEDEKKFAQLAAAKR